MAKKSDRKLLVSLDIGSAKVACIVAELKDDNAIELFGVGTEASQGYKAGIVTDVDALIASIQHALEEAELISGCEVHGVYANITGSHIQATNSHGMCAIKRQQEIGPDDLAHVLNAARAVALPPSQTILHVLPQDYIVDGQEGIREPQGMSGVRLEANYHLITGHNTAVNNLVKCINRCNLDIDDLVLSPVATAEAVLTQDEKNLGVCLIDMGAGSSDMVIYTNGAVHHTAVIPVAGDMVTNDIALALRTPTKDAEKLKLNYGCALAKMASDKQLDVVGMDGLPQQKITQQSLAEVIEARYEETLRFLKNELQSSGLATDVSSGLVLTGGAAKIPGIAELAESVFKMPVRIANPRGVVGLEAVVNDPVYATGIGLLKYARDFSSDVLPAGGKANFGGLLKKTLQWFGKNV